MLHTLRLLLALLTVAALVLALALTTTTIAATTNVQPASTVSAPADGGLPPKAEDATPDPLQARGCWIVCWRR